MGVVGGWDGGEERCRRRGVEGGGCPGDGGLGVLKGCAWRITCSAAAGNLTRACWSCLPACPPAWPHPLQRGVGAHASSNSKQELRDLRTMQEERRIKT